MSAEEAGPATGVLDRLGELARQEAAGDGRVSLGDIVERFGREAFVGIVLVVALLIVSPLSGIPLMPTTSAIIIILVTLQMMVQKRRLWLPGFLLRRSVSAERMDASLARLRRPAGWIDRRLRRRLPALYDWPFRLIVETLIIACAAAMPFLELVPFSSTLLATAISFLCLGLFARDALMVAPALLFIALAAMIPGYVIYSVAT